MGRKSSNVLKDLGSGSGPDSEIFWTGGAATSSGSGDGVRMGRRDFPDALSSFLFLLFDLLWVDFELEWSTDAKKSSSDGKWPVSAAELSDI